MQAKSLRELLDEVDALFPKDRAHNGVIVFSLNRFKSVWSFDVTTTWPNWTKAGYEIRHTGDSPEGAVANFLAYVKRREIDVAGLMGD